MKIDRSMWNIEGHSPIEPIEHAPWWKLWQEAMIKDCLDTIRFVESEISVCVAVIELCGLQSKTGQMCQQQKRLHEVEIEGAEERLQRYKGYFNESN